LAEASLEEAVKLCQGPASQIRLVQVISVARPFHFVEFPLQEMVKGIREERARLTSEARQYLKSVASRVEKGGAQVELTVLEGDPGPTLLQLAHQMPADLIVMSTHGRSGLSRLLMGSVTAYMVAHSSCPVLVVPGRRAEESEVVRLRREVERQAQLIKDLREQVDLAEGSEP
jgi:nucleotide-binding universal stress UspA family protein